MQSMHLVANRGPHRIERMRIHVLVHPKIQLLPGRAVRQQHFRFLTNHLGFQRPQAANVGRAVQQVVPLD